VTLAAGVALLALVRAPLLRAHDAVKRREDAYWLPSAEFTRVVSLGYRSALADFIFASVLVSYGQHFQEKRRFEFAADYLDVVTTLDPKFREPYRLADTLLVFQSQPPKVEDYRRARRLIERGLVAFPDDGELWLLAGQFMAYIAAGQVPAAERDAWRLEGARKLARSCELAGSNETIPRHCVTAALLFNEAGNRSAVKSFLERVFSVSDDPEIQSLASGYLGSVLGAAEREQVEERNRALRAVWARDLTFVSRETLLLLGPRFDPAHCAGLPVPNPEDCVTSFRAWGERRE
jgi:tetratricopeptide (TPR) repeat protein